jgi:arylsulfatase A-like enzyme
VGGGQDPLHDLWENDREVFCNGEYLTELITRRAVEYVRRAAGENEPFFMYVPYNAPHYPMHAPKEYVDRFPHLPPDRRIMAAMLSAVDDGVGDIVAELERQGILQDTIITFQSDNGPSRETRNWLDGRRDPYYGGSAGMLKGHKFSLYEGGIRSPGIISWPANIPTGQVLDVPAAAMDIFPTLLTAAGGDVAAYELDGADIMPALTGDATPEERKALDERPIYWEMDGQTAVRRGPWKLVLHGQLVEGAPPEDDVHLADLSRDMGERHNLAAGMPAVADELRAMAEAWREGIEVRWQREWLPQTQGTTTHERE